MAILFLVLSGTILSLFPFPLFQLSPLYAAESSDAVSDVNKESLKAASQKHLIRGVYHLINQSDLISAESEFRQAIALDGHNGEAYYFLGRIYYEVLTSLPYRSQKKYEVLTSLSAGDAPTSQLQQSIGRAKALLLRAQELGVTYDKLHPDLLSRLKQEYPKVAPIYEEEFFPRKAKITIETKEPTFEIRVLKITEQNAAMEPSSLGTFLPDEEIQLEGGASYQLEFPPPKPKNLKHLILIGIGLAIWLIR